MKRYVLVFLALVLCASILSTLAVSGDPVIVKGSNIQDNTITGGKIQDNAVTPGKMNTTTAPGDNNASYRRDGTWVLPTGYTLSVRSGMDNPADNEVLYFGNLPVSPTTTPTNAKIYIPKSGTLKVAHITGYADGDAGTSEAWPLYVVLDNTTSTLIASVAGNTSFRSWDNTAMSVAVTAGSYIEIKSVCPAWATNPLEYYFGGYVYIE